MRILWLGEVGVGTSWCRVTEEMAVELMMLGHRLTVISRSPNVNNLKYMFEVHYGNDVSVTRERQFDVVIFLGSVQDCIDIYPDLRVMKIPMVACYCPVEYKNIDSEGLQFYDKVFTMTEFGREQIKSVDAHVVPHGVSLPHFYPMDKRKCRSVVRRLGIDIADEDFVVFGGNRNERRKRLDLTIQAYDEFKERHCPKAKLWLHCGGRFGENWENQRMRGTSELLHRKDIVVTSRYSTKHPNMTTEMLNVFYNCADVGISTSTGEGWGLVTFEMAACCIPQVCPNFSSFTELFEGRAHLVKVKEEPVDWSDDGNVGGVIDIEDAVAKLYESLISPVVVDPCYISALSYKFAADTMSQLLT